MAKEWKREDKRAGNGCAGGGWRSRRKKLSRTRGPDSARDGEGRGSEEAGNNEEEDVGCGTRLRQRGITGERDVSVPLYFSTSSTRIGRCRLNFRSVVPFARHYRSFPPCYQRTEPARLRRVQFSVPRETRRNVSRANRARFSRCEISDEGRNHFRAESLTSDSTKSYRFQSLLVNDNFASILV